MIENFRIFSLFIYFDNYFQSMLILIKLRLEGTNRLVYKKEYFICDSLFQNFEHLLVKISFAFFLIIKKNCCKLLTSTYHLISI